MPADTRLSPRVRRVVLEQLTRQRLSELTEKFELEVADRRSTDAHVDAIVRKRSLDFAQLLELLRANELRAACTALGLEARGREKAKLIARILGQDVAGKEGSDQQEGPAKRSEEDAKPEERATSPSSPASQPSPQSARAGGALKSALRRFVLDIAGGLRGRDASVQFTTQLLRCFGWTEEHGPDATKPASVAVVANGKRSTREVALLWPSRRVLLDVVKHDVMLDFAWKELLGVCLQVTPQPQYVVLTNQRDLHMYDLARDRDAPRLSIALDDLPKYSEAFPFLSPDWVPGTTPKITDITKVSREVAELVARLYRSLKEQHPERERDVVQFTLQCILTMFAEDIGLLPREYFTSLLYEGARSRDAERRLEELFRQMSTRELPTPRVVPFFNGGLFTNAVTLPLGDAQLGALTKASEANWKYVDPHIFGSVFQGILSDAERHKRGAHYTAHDDIMRVVGPTIVEPWRQKIRGAKSLTELLEVRAALLKFRVLDPACGSGNFLYVAFRELYRLDTELLARFREFPSTQGQGKGRITWGVAIETANFFGIDINPFAVELAKVTLNIAKKIAFDERREFAADIVGQLELDVDPSLPLDNLDKNIVCADALFTEWPKVHAIIGNPPFLGGQKIRRELGLEYLAQLQKTTRVRGVVDMACYWFRKAHDRLPEMGRAGLIGTSAIRIGKAREASLDYVATHGGTITNAVSSRVWPGEAALNVSMVNWVKGHLDGPHQLLVESHVYDLASIPSHLQLHRDLTTTRTIEANKSGTTMGVIFGHESFRFGHDDSLDFSERAVRPAATGDDMLRGRLSIAPEYCIYFGRCRTEHEASQLGTKALYYLRKQLYPWLAERAGGARDTGDYATWFRKWWRPQKAREDFMSSVENKPRIIVCASPQARPIFTFISTRFVPTNTLQVFAFDDDYSFGIIQSSLHWVWTKAKGGKVRADIRYTSAVWATFPWPQEPNEEEAVAVANAARNLRRVRDELMKDSGWSLRALYQAAEVAGTHPLKSAQADLDEAVRRAYGMPGDQEATEFLYELNQLVAEDEAEGRPVQGPGVPRGLDPKDPRFTSADCIEPPKL